MSPGRFISLLLYGFVCALLGGVAYRRGLGPVVVRLAKLRDHVGKLGHANHCDDCREGVEAIDELVRRYGPVHRAQHERRP